LDGVAAFGSVETGHFQEELGHRERHIGKLSKDPAAAFGSVMGSDEYFAGFVQDVLATLLLAFQVDEIVPAERIEEDVHVIFAAVFFDAGAGVDGGRFDDAAPQTHQSGGRNVDLFPT